MRDNSVYLLVEVYAREILVELSLDREKNKILFREFVSEILLLLDYYS